MIINADRAVGPRDYEDLAANQLRVFSMFYTIQGEGPYAGRPALFLRLAGCNYGAKTKYCQFCDTKFDYDQGKVEYFDNILIDAASRWDRINLKHHPRLMVITGGEPLMQWTLNNFCIIALAEGWDIQIESNGSLHQDLDEEVMLVVSPKAPNPYEGGTYGKISPKVHERANCFKFLIEDKPGAYHDVPAWAKEPDYAKVTYLSPIAVYKKAPPSGDSSIPEDVASFWDPEMMDLEACHANHLRAAKLVMEHGFRLSVQMHLLLTVP